MAWPRARAAARTRRRAAIGLLFAVLASALAVTTHAAWWQAPPSPPGPTKARANSYDDPWKSAWVTHGRALLSAPGKTTGFVLEIGDSITHSRAYSSWAAGGQGQTAEDAALITWARGSVWSGTETDTANKNGFYLTGADTTGQRGMLSSSGISTSELVTGCCNGGPTMPSASDSVTARGLVADGTYTGNLQIDSLIAAFGDAQFAIVMLGTNDPGNPTGLADLTTIVTKLEAAHILPILSTIPPRNDATSNDLNVAFNAGVRALAQAHSLPLIDFYQEVVLRQPGTSWFNTLISSDGVHPTGDRAGFTVTSNPYVPGGDPATHTTGDAAANVGYLLRGWLTVQKLKEVKRYVVDGIDPPVPPTQDDFDPGANNVVRALALQPDGKIVVGGGFTTLGGGGTGTSARSRIGRLNADGSLDAGFDPGANNDVYALAVQADGKILVGGNFTTLGGGGTGTTARNDLGRLNADGSLDASFNPGANGQISALAVQPDGKILVGGGFTTLGGGGTGTSTRNRLGRLNADGSLDASFNPGVNGQIASLVVQPDGKIVVGGGFSTLGGGGTGTTARNDLGRLNADGSLDASFNPGANNGVFALAVQPDGKILVAGNFTTLGGGGTGTTPRASIGRLNADGSLDASFNPGANAAINALAVQPDGRILVGGIFTTLGGGGTGTTTRNDLGRLNADGSLDAGFNPGANGGVQALAVQADAKILAGGTFTTLGGGGTGTTPRANVGRLNADGSLDTSFNPGANGQAYALALQPDGKILVGGNFTTLGGGGTGTSPRASIGRLNADGSIDPSFDPGTNGTVTSLAVQADGKILVGGLFTMLGGGGTGTTFGNDIGRFNPTDGSLDLSFNPGANSFVYALAVQADGKILVGGGFTKLGGGGNGVTTRNSLGRLNPDGSIDATFNPGANGLVYAIVVQPDGKILVGGSFTMLGGGGTGTTSRRYVGRLNADGSLDASFNPGADYIVNALATQADGKILVGGSFSMLGGGTGTTPRSFLGRINADGSLDASFDPGANSLVYSLAAQADGKVLVGGGFTTLGGGGTGTTARNDVGRLSADGSLDTSFDPGANGTVTSLLVQADGRILIGGSFTTLGGGGTGTTPRNSIGRVTNTGAATASLGVTQNNIVTWLRGGTGPELSRVTFESSADGTTYAALGNGTRVVNGWQLAGQSLPTAQPVYIRARGYFATGFHDGSGSVVESVTRATARPAALTRNPSALNFTATKNGAASATLVNQTPAQSVAIGFSGSSPTWTAVADESWLQITGGSGTGSKQFTIGIINPGNVIAGSTALTGTVYVTSATAAPVVIVVNLTVQQTIGSSVPAFGQLETPAQSAANLQGAIALTGWALDDVGVASVQVFRQCFAFDNPASCQLIGADSVVYVGDGNFVAGARPDVEAVFPTYPFNYRAGWGLLVLTNFLPHVPNGQVFGGQGAIQFFAYANDQEGHRTLLGRSAVDHTPTSVTLDNDHIAKPFGNLDTPVQSATVSGSIAVFSWVLTPDLDTIAGNGHPGSAVMTPRGRVTNPVATDIWMPYDGSTQILYVDSIPIGPMTYDQCRGNNGNPPPPGVFCNDDVADAFGNVAPQPPLTNRTSNPTKFRNLDVRHGAIGSRILDTTTLTNGQHVIGLLATDTATRADGIGSRFMTVANGGSFAPGSDELQTLLDAPAKSRGVASSLDVLPLSGRLMSVRTGFGQAAAATEMARTASGIRTVTVPVMGRVELGLATPVTAGYLVTNGELRDLPIGAHLDTATGVFSWVPPPGYLGTYRLAFVIGGERVVVDVTVTGDSAASR